MTRSNKDILLEYADVVWNEHDLERGRTYMTSEFAAGEAVVHLAELFAAFPDLHVDVLEPGLIAEGEYVVVRVGITGTHDGADFAGVAPSGRTHRWESIRIFRFDAGLIADTWAMQDRLGLMEQLGVVSSSAGEVHWAGGVDPATE